MCSTAGAEALVYGLTGAFKLGKDLLVSLQIVEVYLQC